MKTLEISDADGPVAAYARRPHSRPMILTINGKPVAAVTPISELDFECGRLAANPRFQAIIEQSWREYLDSGGLSTQEMRRRLGLPAPSRRRKRSKR